MSGAGLVRLRAFAELGKPRLSALAVFAVIAGCCIGWAPHAWPPLDRVLGTTAGTFLIAAGSAALNMYRERELDARMRRTEARPLPSGRLSPREVLAFGLGVSALGVAVLWLASNWVATAICALILLSYVLVYTPMKTRTPLNTFVGAIPGALPPVLGWTAATNQLGIGAFALFAILFLWQLPHFHAIARIYRDDYARGGLVMLPAHDPDGSLTARQACVHAIALCLVALLPFAIGMGGALYLIGALLLVPVFLVPAWRFLRAPADASARALMRASLVWLPGWLCLVAIGR